MKRHAATRLLCIVSSAALCACTTINPYRPQPVMDQLVVSGKGQTGVRFAGELDEALRSADSLRNDYYSDLKGSAASRAFGALSLYSLGAWGILATTKADSGASDALRAARVGAVGSVAFLSTDYFVNKLHEASYADGYNAVTCLMLQTLPLRWPLADTDEVAQHGGAPGERLSLQSFSKRLTTLEKSINNGYEERDAALAAISTKDPSTFSTHSLDRQRAAWREREEALYIARTALKEGRVLEQLVIGSGQTLRTHVALVAAAVNTRIASGQKELPRPKETYGAIRDFTTSFKDVGEETTTALQATKPALADTPAAAAPPSPSAEAGKTAAPAKAEPAADNLPATQAQLAKVQDAVIELLVDKKALAQAIADRSVKNMVKRAREEERKKLGAEAAAREKARSVDACDAPKCSLASWGAATNKIHEDRRPVSQALISFREVARSLSTVQQCQPDGGAVVISPAETRLATAPSVHEFVISDPDGGIPNVALSGNSGMPDGKGLLAIIRNGLVIAQVSVGKEAPSGDLLLTATDAKGRRSKTVTLRVSPANAPAIVYPAALGGSK